ncbi:MAG: hypothetical protein AAF926_04180 [Pseudomonadota bacterium]
MNQNKVLRIVALIAAFIAAPVAAGRIALQPQWLDLLASVTIGAITGLTLLFLFRRLPVHEDDDSSKG